MQPIIQTFSGKLFNLADPNRDDIDILDIAHALSMICRFTGHCTRFYSVAEHSVYVARLVEPRFKLRALLHDASEAYLGDVSSPLKNSPQLLEYGKLEFKLQYMINRKFQVCGGRQHYKPSDKAMTGFEAIHLLRGRLLDSQWAPYIELAHNEVRLRNFELECLPPEEAEQLFLNTYYELSNV